MRVNLVILFVYFYSTLQGQSMLQVEITKTEAKCGNGSAQLSITGGQTPYTILWSTGTSGVKLYDAAPGHYTVNIQDDLGTDTTLVFSIIDEECEVSISNHFTPNDDGYNDAWGILNINFYPDFDLYVYNRWGQLVHHQSQQYYPWNGTRFGIPVPDGAYFYIFYFDKNDKKRLLQGDVNILR